MATRRLRPSLLSVSVALILAVVSVVGYGLSKSNTDKQEQALLQDNATQAASFVSEALGSATSLTSTAALVTSTNGSPTAFEQAAPATSPLVMLLVKKTGSAYVVAAGSGGGFHSGQVLEGDSLSTVEHAGAKLIAGPVDFNGKLSTARFAIGEPTVPAGLVIYEQFSIDPYTAPVTTGKPFEQLKVALYGAGPISMHNLLGSTSSSLPLSGPVARATVTVGSSDWTLVAVARHPLIGGFAKSSSIMLLVLGLLMAIIVGVAIEILARRRRYAEGVAAERTQELTAAQAALVRRERLSAVGEMATVIGHELRNPLGAVVNLLFLARNGLTDHDNPELDGYLVRAERETNRAAALSEDLTAYMRERPPVIMPLDLGALVTEVLESTPPPTGIEVSAGDLGIDLAADQAQLVQMVTNLITNAYQAMPDGGLVRVTGTESDGFVEIAVQDSGVGIDPAVAERLLEPFFTTKPTGTGLGLAIVKRFAEGHDGTVSIENGPGGGARVTIRLPHATAEATP